MASVTTLVAAWIAVVAAALFNGADAQSVPTIQARQPAPAPSLYVASSIVPF